MLGVVNCGQPRCVLRGVDAAVVWGLKKLRVSVMVGCLRELLFVVSTHIRMVPCLLMPLRKARGEVWSYKG